MTDQRIPAAPAGSKTSGKRLWRSILAEYELEEHETALLREMVRTVDQLDALQAAVDRDGLMVAGPGMAKRVHPAAVEARQARIARPGSASRYCRARWRAPWLLEWRCYCIRRRCPAPVSASSQARDR